MSFSWLSLGILICFPFLLTDALHGDSLLLVNWFTLIEDHLVFNFSNSNKNKKLYWLRSPEFVDFNSYLFITIYLHRTLCRIAFSRFKCFLKKRLKCQKLSCFKEMWLTFIQLSKDCSWYSSLINWLALWLDILTYIVSMSYIEHHPQVTSSQSCS